MEPASASPSLPPSASPAGDDQPLTARWRRVVSQLEELSGRWEGKDRVMNRCKRLTGIDMESPARWIYWVKLARWMEESRATDPLPTSELELGSALYDMVKAQGDESAVTNTAARDAFSLTGAAGDAAGVSFAVLCIGTANDDPRGWFLFGRCYDRDGRAALATKAYAQALQRGRPPGDPGWHPQLWYGVARALKTVPGHSLEREFWTWAREPAANVLDGLRLACEPEVYDRVMRVCPRR